MAACIGGILIDLSGTTHIGDKVIGNSIKAILRLREAGVPFYFVTNTTKESKKTVIERIKTAGLLVDEHEVYTSLSAAKSYMFENNLRPFFMLSDDAMSEFSDLECSNPNAVLVGLAPERFSYCHMNQAFRLIQNGCNLIAVHKAKYYRTENGCLNLGPGPFVSMLEFACDTTAIVIGKPEKEFFCNALKQFGNGIRNEEIYMIGDDVHSDIEGAQALGIKGILVKTGKYRSGDENKISPPPYKVCEDFGEAVDWLLNQINQWNPRCIAATK